jgi:hydrogenase maturation protease
VAPLTRLVVGLGNPLAGSDGFGVAVLARLAARGGLPPHVSLLDAGTDLLGHLDDFLAYDEVVLVDVVLGMPSGGHVVLVDEETFNTWPESAASCHHMSPLVAVKLFRTLHPEAATRIRLIGYAVDEVALGGVVQDAAVEAGAAAVGRLVGIGSAGAGNELT